MHLVIKTINPTVVAVDPISNFITAADQSGVKSMLIRLVDFLKMRQITALFTHLASSGIAVDRTDENVSSIMDTWLLLRNLERRGRRSCVLYVLKSRGMPHSHDSRRFLLGDNGIQLGELDSRDTVVAEQPGVAAGLQETYAIPE
jgi:circadian clock protein KaiC